jgi:hypothetical protein
LNKVLDSEAFIDLDETECAKNKSSKLVNSIQINQNLKSEQVNDQVSPPNETTEINEPNGFLESSTKLLELGINTTTSIITSTHCHSSNNHPSATNLGNIKDYSVSESSVSSSSAQLNMPSALTASSVSPSVSLDSSSSLSFNKQNINRNITSKHLMAKNQNEKSGSSGCSSPKAIDQSITIIDEHEINDTNTVNDISDASNKASQVQTRTRASSNHNNKISRSSRLFNTIIRMSTIGNRSSFLFLLVLCSKTIS